MKLEVGMYVRTKFGHIAKINHLPNSLYLKIILDKDYLDTSGDLNCGISKEDVEKASHNIIDLIEEGDILDYEFGGIISKSEVIKEDNELGIGWDDDGDFINLESLYINSIVTKEQFESMSYKVGE